MSTATPEPLRPIPFPRPRRDGGGRLYVVVVGAIGVASVVAFGGSLVAARHSVRGLAPEQRVALLSRTVDELRRSCGSPRPPALEDHCRELASFAAQFDECRGECETLIRPLVTPTPTR